MKKKKRLKRKIKLLLVLLFLVIIGILSVIVLRPVICKNMIRSKGYSKEAAELFFKSDMTKEITDKDYSKTVDEMIINDKYKSDYLDKYYEIKYVDDKLFIDNINTLIEKEYSTDLINSIYTKYSSESIKYLTENKLFDVDKYIEVEIFKPDNISRYVKINTKEYKDKVLYVNMHRDEDVYKNPVIVKTYSTSMLVNKHYSLTSDYKPDLVRLDNCSTDEHYLTKEAKEAWDKMCKAAAKDGYALDVTSSYRSYSDQVATEKYYLKLYGQNYINKYVARPGFSEHQTGLSLDVKSKKGSPFKTTKEYTWMVNNSYKYGFILRFPEGKEAFTGFNPESWHFRYVGEEIAKYIHENGITYDEYFALFIDK